MREIDSKTFETEVVNSEKPVLVDFYTDWCAPCKSLVPIVEMVEAKADGRFNVFKLNIDDAPEIAARYKIKGVPTLIVFIVGNDKATQSGRLSFEKLMD